MNSVISQHAEEAAFNWLLRDAAVRAPHYDLKDLADLDDRVEAHFDGLRVAGDEGWAIVKEELGWKEAGEVFTAAALAFESKNQERIDEVLEIASSDIELARGVVSALSWLTLERAKPHFEKLLASDDPIHNRIGLAAASTHRHEPGTALTQAVEHDEPGLRARALRAIGELGSVKSLHQVKRHANDKDDTLRFWAAWSAALLGDGTAVLPLRGIATSGGVFADRAADIAARRMPPTIAVAWQKELAAKSDTVRLAATVAGAIGDPVLVPWLIDMMPNDTVARPVGEAFTMITGVDLAYDDLERDWPEDFAAGPTENPEDEDVAMDADEDLPWPDQGLISAWWKENGSRFTPGTRHLLGRPIAPEPLQAVLITGRQRQRAAAALEQALAQPGTPLFEVRAPGYRQKRLLVPS